MKYVGNVPGGEPIKQVDGVVVGDGNTTPPALPQTFSLQSQNQGMGTQVQSTVSNPFLDRPDKTAEDYKDKLGKKYADNIAEDINEANQQIGLKYAQIQQDLTRLMRAIGNQNDPRYITAQSYLDDLHAIQPKDFTFAKGKNEANYKDAKAQVTRDLNTKIALLDRILQDSNYVQLVQATQQINATTVGVGSAVAGAVTDAVDAGVTAVTDAVHDDGDATRQAVHAEGAATRRTVHAEGVTTRRTVVRAARTIMDQAAANTEAIIRQNAANTQIITDQNDANTQRIIDHTTNMTQQQADRIIDTLDPLGVNRATKWVRDQAAAAGQEIGQFVLNHPGVLIPGLGIPLGMATRLLR